MVCYRIDFGLYVICALNFVYRFWLSAAECGRPSGLMQYFQFTHPHVFTDCVNKAQSVLSTGQYAILNQTCSPIQNMYADLIKSFVQTAGFSAGNTVTARNRKMSPSPHDFALLELTSKLLDFLICLGGRSSVLISAGCR